jgi:hypothetical protein
MSGPWERYAQPTSGPWERYAQAPAEQPKAEPEQPKAGMLANLAAGAVRGAGSIGATLVDAARTLGDSVTQATPAAMRPAVTAGNASAPRGAELRSGMDGGLQALGADPSSVAYQGGKIGAEVLGTLGVGGALAKGATAPAVVEALRTGGMSVAGTKGLQGLALRASGGAATGGVTAGLIDPDHAASGSVLGAALPVGLVGLGRAGQALGAKTHQNVNPQLLDSAKDAIGAGYVIPPATVKPTFTNRVLESTAGKMATQQMASAKNQNVTQGLIRKALGLPEDATLNLATLEGIRKEAGKAYQAIADLPVKPAQGASGLMNQAEQAAIKPRQMIESLKQARNDAQSWFKSYNASANPEHLAKAKAAESLASQLEDTLEGYAASLNAPELLPALREARKRIAQTYTVERALNEATGSVDARVFGKLFAKGKPLSDGLEKVGRFGSAFPTVAKLPEVVGSPDAHNLRSVASLALGSGGLASAGPLGLLAGALPYAAPATARSLMFSKSAQRGLLSEPATAAAPQIGLLTDAIRRTSPVLLAQ